MLNQLIEEKPKLYSKTTIMFFSILLSTFFGGILYYQNLSVSEHRKQRAPLLFFCLLWNAMAFKVAHKFTDNFILTFIVPNIIGGIILSTIFWNYHFKNFDYKPKTIWVPLLFVFAIYGFFIGLNIFFRK